MTSTTSAERPAIGRRELIAGVGAVLAGVTISPPGRSFLGGLFGSAEPFEAASLAEHLGASFRVLDGAFRGSTMVLDSVTPLVTAGRPDLQFVVEFAAGSGTAFAEDLYRFGSTDFGELLLYVQPMAGPSGATVGYRAIVDRFVPHGAPPPPKGASDE